MRAIEDVVAASLPVAYLTAQITLTLAGFKPGKTVLAPGIGGSVGNATYQLARAQSAGKVISTAGSAVKAAKARELGFDDVIDLTTEGIAGGVRRITAGNRRGGDPRGSGARVTHGRLRHDGAASRTGGAGSR
jgi:NADPH:quinone reductase-like Zn-dependent oxidoreductase